jgi:hypothetical protein
MDAKNKMNRINIMLATALLLLIACLSAMVHSYVKLQQSYPLENLRGAILQPVYDGDPVLEFKGTYDRYVKCNMKGFDVTLYNVDTQDIITLNHQHLAKPVPIIPTPSNDIKIQFALFMPKTMYPGTWKPSFTGFYICQLGIFVDPKIQVITPEAFVIKPVVVEKQ